jgi:glycosyltransferase involved in cell wall biosynthesis
MPSWIQRRRNGHRVLYAGFRWDHHDNESGYHHVVESTCDYVDGGTLWGGSGSVKTIRRRLNFVLIDFLTIVRSLPYDAVLVFYPEQTAYVSPFVLRMLGKQVVYVVHLGDDFWSAKDRSLVRNLKRFNLRFVNKFITLTHQQRTVFDAMFPGKVKLIPHGSWCSGEFVEVARVAAVPAHIAVVGDPYRDYELLGRIADDFSKRHPDVVFDLVGMKREKLGGLASLPNVRIHARLSSQAYRKVISEAFFILLPLRFATANNALLEGLTRGIPVLCSDVAGVREYLPEGEYVFSDVEDLAKKYERRLDLSEGDRETEALMLMSYARQHYSWEIIRERVRNYCLA